MNLLDIVYNYSTPELSLIYNYFEYDLHNFIRYHYKKKELIPLLTIKYILFEILKGLYHLHNNWIIHCDIKPQNILLSRKTGSVVITDFGLSHVMNSSVNNYINYQKHLDLNIVTLWYRSPEILLGCKSYNCEVDIWSVGCIFCEVYFYFLCFYFLIIFRC